MPREQSIKDIPLEILSEILTHLPDLTSASFVNRTFRLAALPLIYHTIDLVDADYGRGDCHNDIKIIKKLYILAKNPGLAAHVRKVRHRCHLPPPDIFDGLHQTSFQGPLHAHSAQTIHLLFIAIKNMTGVHTLEIVFGHRSFSVALLRGFFSPRRRDCASIRRLWIESTCIEGIFDWPSQVLGSEENASFAGLQSLRLRRLRIAPERDADQESLSTRKPHLTPEYILIRGEGFSSDDYYGPKNSMPFNVFSDTWKDEANSMTTTWAHEIDEVYPEVKELVTENGNIWDWVWSDYSPSRCTYDTPMSFTVAIGQTAAATLTSLTLDWTIGIDNQMQTLFLSLPTFPNLLAFQLRNLIAPPTSISRERVFLLEPQTPFFNFLKNHPKLQCLSWPLEHFIPGYGRYEIQDDPVVQSVVHNLGCNLKTLRLDQFLFDDFDFAQNDFSISIRSGKEISRRRFIEQFAPTLKAVEILKIEGGCQRTEVRELVRAVKDCPIKKFVYISTIWPLTASLSAVKAMGNFVETAGDTDDVLASLIKVFGAIQLEQAPWPSYANVGPLILDLIAIQFAKTIEEIKFCGFGGAPDILIKDDMGLLSRVLAPLRCFDRLICVHLPFTLRTSSVEYPITERELASYWRPFGVLGPISSDDDLSADTLPLSPFEEMTPHLAELYHPRNLAEHLHSMVGKHLSTKRTKNTDVKALIYLDTEILDFTITISPENKIVRRNGPRGEMNADKLQEKYENRSWY